MPTVFLLLWATLAPNLAPVVVGGFGDVDDCYKAARIARKKSQAEMDSAEAQAIGLTFVCVRVVGNV